MEQALKFMEEFLNDEEIRNVYDKINDVERYAKREGITKIAKNMLEMNFSMEDIAKATGLSIKEVEALK